MRRQSLALFNLTWECACGVTQSFHGSEHGHVLNDMCGKAARIDLGLQINLSE